MDLDAVLDMLGAPKPTSTTKKEIASLEEWLGKPLPIETKTYLSRPLPLWNDDADHPKIKDTSWLGRLPDVGAWIEQLGKGYEGRLHCVNQFFGLYPIGCQLNRGDYMFAHLVLEPYTKTLGGVMYYDEREIGTWGGSVTTFLLRELAKFNEEVESAIDEDDPKAKVDLDDLRDCFRFAQYKRKAAPAAPALPAAVESAWKAHWRWRLERRQRWWVQGFIGGADPRQLIDSMPTEKEWNDEKSGVCKTHHEGMYWLLAHWLLGNREELAEAVTLAKKNPSKLVAILSKYVATTKLPPKLDKQLASVLSAAREARPGS